MTTNNTPNVVLIEEKKRRKGLLWVAGGAAALLLGGSTFALWSASDTFSGGTITAGDLNIAKTADTTFWDVSADRADATTTVTGTDGTQKGHSLDPANASTWRIVPGDKVAASFSSDVTLEGDNLVGKLSLDGLNANTLANTGLTYSYEVYQAGKKIVNETALPTAASAPLMYFSAPATGQDAGLEDAYGSEVLSMADTTEDITVVVYGAFDAETADRDQVTVADTLADMTLKLEQVRDEGTQFATAPTPTPAA